MAILFVWIFHPPYLPYKAYQVLNVTVVLGLFAYATSQQIGKKSIYILIYGIIIIVSTYVARGFGVEIVYGSLQTIFIYNIFIITQNAVRRYGSYGAIKILKKICLAYLCVTDALIIAGVSHVIDGEVVYLCGNKFGVAYMHLIFLALQMSSNEFIHRSKIRYTLSWILMCAGSGLICLMVDCTTGVVGSVFMMISMFTLKRVQKLMIRPTAFLVFFIAVNFLIVGTRVFFSGSSISNLLIDIFNDDFTMLGRYRIYDKISMIISQKLFLGYGYNSSIVEEIVGFGNAQNGILHIWVQYGIFGALAFLLICVTAIKNIEIRLNTIFPILLMVYIFVVISTIEINFSNEFFLLLSLLYTPKTLEVHHEIQRNTANI